MLPLAVGLLAGIAADHFLSFPLLLSIGLFAIGVALYFLCRDSERISLSALIVMAAGLGTSRHAIADRWFAGDHVVRYVAGEPILVHLAGQVVTAPEIAEQNPDAVMAYEIGPKTRFIIEAKTMDGKNGPIAVSGRVAVTVKSPILTLQAGDVVRMTGWFYRPLGPRNPGEYDWAQRQRRSGIRAAFVCDHSESVNVVGTAVLTGWRGWLTIARNRLRGYVLDPAFDEGDPGAGVVAAMVLAQRSAVPRETNDAFIRTGNAHLLAASGMNVAWLVAVGWFVMRLIGAHYRIAALVVAVLILSYGLLAEPQPSILRAGIGGLLWCLCIFLRGRSHPLNWLACAAVVLLMIDPMEAFRPGFQFSFLAVLSLIYFCPHVARWFAVVCLRLNPRVARELDRSLYAATLTESTTGLSGVDRLVVWLLTVLAMSVSAWFVTSPLSCYIFNNFNPFGALNTFVVTFLALLVTWVGYGAALLGLLFPSAAAIVGPILGFTTHVMLGLVEWLARLPGMYVSGRQPSTAWLIAFYAVLWLRIYRPTAKVKTDESGTSRNEKPRPLIGRLRRHGFTIAGMVLLVWWLIPPRWVTHDRHALKVWMLAVGDGTGTVIELPNGKTILYDFGTRSAFDAGPLAVSFLQSRAIDRIDAVFVSHTDFDHYGGIETIAQTIPIGRVILNDHFERFAPENSGPRRFIEVISQRGIPIDFWSGPQVLNDTGDVRIESIWPPPANDRRLVAANEASTVLRLTYEGRSILLTGDIAEAALGTLVSDHAEVLKADALALPHHGSVVHNTAAFIEAVDPRIAVRSSGQRRNLTTNRIEQLVGPRTYFNTADDGCILLTIRDGALSDEAVTKPRRSR